MLAASSEVNYSDPELLRKFYAEIFPCRELVSWLSYGNPKNLRNREFSFTFANGSYLRFQSFDRAEQLQAFLISNCPVKIDLGAIYTTKPSERKSLADPKSFKPLERELIFDLDMTDYDEVRTCCDGKTVCEKCWKFLACAMKIIDSALEEDFGYQHRMWVFSGRRGIHCWVADEKARKLNPSGRKALVSYFEEQTKNMSDGAVYSNSRQNHPFFKRSMAIMEHYFTTYILVQQNVLKHPEFVSKLQDVVGGKDALDDLIDTNNLDMPYVWRKATEIAGDSQEKKAILRSIVMHYLLPRIDSHVSIQLNHLLKLPFCIHPDSGKICTPIKPENIEMFDPSAVDTMDKLFVAKMTNGQVDIGLDSLARMC